MLTRAACLLEMCISMSLPAQNHPVAKNSNEFICSIIFFIFVFPKSKLNAKMNELISLSRIFFTLHPGGRRSLVLVHTYQDSFVSANILLCLCLPLPRIE